MIPRAISRGRGWEIEAPLSGHHRLRPWPGGISQPLARRFAAAQPNTAWVTDITYLWTPQGWLYLAVITDLVSHRIGRWSMSERIDPKLTLDALKMALAQRRPAPGLIHHSDRGGQYASGDYQQLLAQYGTRASMSRRGDCWDNAVAESFFASLKKDSFTKFNGEPVLRPAPRSSNISNSSITAVGVIRRSAISARWDLNNVTVCDWQLNPGVHQRGASLVLDAAGSDRPPGKGFVSESIGKAEGVVILK
jgi:transposase InsO family protein